MYLLSKRERTHGDARANAVHAVKLLARVRITSRAHTVGHIRVAVLARHARHWNRGRTMYNFGNKNMKAG